MHSRPAQCGFGGSGVCVGWWRYVIDAGPTRVGCPPPTTRSRLVDPSLARQLTTRTNVATVGAAVEPPPRYVACYFSRVCNGWGMAGNGGIRGTGRGPERGVVAGRLGGSCTLRDAV